MQFLEYNEESSMSGSKFVWECGKITHDAKTTAGWLESVTALQTIDKHKALQMSGKKILEAIFNKRAKVVVKIANHTEDIEKEWTTYQGLLAAQIPGILKYLCFFTCNDAITNYLTNRAHMCDGPGESMRVLVMEYVPGSSFKNFKWGKYDVIVIRSCAKQVILTMLYAYEQCGFIHGDLHLDNVLLQKTTKSELTFGQHTVSVYGYKTLLMDLELSKVNTGASVTELFKDVKVFINKMLNLADFIDVAPIVAANTKLRDWIDSKEANSNKLLELIPLLDQIKSTGFKGGLSLKRVRNAKPRI